MHGSMIFCRYILSISGSLLIKFNNTFLFPHPEPPINNIWYWESGTYGHFGLFPLLF